MIGLIKETIDRLRYKIPLRPRQIQIEITNRCNMDCPMCQREDLGIELEHMSWSHFTTVVDKLGQHEDITLTGWGEPFIHPRVFDMIAYCKERGHKVMVTSNGLFTKPSMVDDILNSAVDTVTFSIDSVNGNETVSEGHTSNKVYENIEAVVKGRNPEPWGLDCKPPCTWAAKTISTMSSVTEPGSDVTSSTWAGLIDSSGLI